MNHVLLLKLSIKINYNESQINIAKFLPTNENKKVPALLRVIKASLYCWVIDWPQFINSNTQAD